MANVGISSGSIAKGIFLSGLSNRMDIREYFGLSKGAVTLIVNRMLEEGLLLEGKKSNVNQRGRKTTALHLRSDISYFLGVDLEGLALRACLIDCNKNVITCGRRTMLQSWTQGMITRQWLNLIDEVLNNSGIDKKKIAGVGIGLPGLVDRENCRSRAYLPPGKWLEFDAGKKLSSLDLPLATANNVFCVTEYEKAMGVARDRKDFISILVRYGIGMSVCSNGCVLSMNNMNAGEFGHMQIDLKGKECICGQKGCLDTFASGRTWKQVDISSESVLKRELKKRANHLGTGLSNVVKLFYSPAIILNGIYNNYPEFFVESLKDSICSRVGNLGIRTPEVVLGEAIEFKTSIGAAIIAAERYLASFLDDQIGN